MLSGGMIPCGEIIMKNKSQGRGHLGWMERGGAEAHQQGHGDNNGFCTMGGGWKSVSSVSFLLFILHIYFTSGPLVHVKLISV